MRPLRALVIEPSAVLRHAIASTLREGSGFEVTAVADAHLAERRLAQWDAQVVIADVDDPRARGLAFVEKHARSANLGVIVSTANASGEDVIRALSSGASGAIRKTRTEVVDASEWARVARRVGLAHASTTAAPNADVEATPASPATATWPTSLIVIGASTGGTYALPRVLASLPADAPPVLVVQHMVADMTEPFSRTLAAACRPEVRVARAGDVVRSGLVLLAPGGQHMRVEANRGLVAITVDEAPPENGHRPSVDVLFASVARLEVASVVCVILTGMGNDGAEGMAALRAKGAVTIAQDAMTSTVFGMPRRAVERGVVDMVLPIDDIGPVVCAAARRGGAAARARSA